MMRAAWALAWAAILGNAARADRQFAYKFVPGNELRAVHRFDRGFTRTIKEKRVTIDRKVEVHSTAIVRGVTDKGVATLDLAVTKVTFSENGPGSRRYASDDPQKQDSADGWELYAGAKLAFEIDPKGKILSAKPDTDTAEYWAKQPREYADMLAGEALYRLAPAQLPLPEGTVVANVGWRDAKTLDEGKLGRREASTLYTLAGNRRERGRVLDEIAIRADVKGLEGGRFELLVANVEGRADFEAEAGMLWNFEAMEDILYNPKGAKLPKNVELVGAPLPMPEAETPAAPKPAAKEKKKDGKKDKKKEEKEKEDKEKADAEDKSVEVVLIRNVKLTYYGPPLKDIE